MLARDGRELREELGRRAERVDWGEKAREGRSVGCASGKPGKGRRQRHSQTTSALPVLLDEPDQVRTSTQAFASLPSVLASVATRLWYDASSCRTVLGRRAGERARRELWSVRLRLSSRRGRGAGRRTRGLAAACEARRAERPWRPSTREQALPPGASRRGRPRRPAPRASRGAAGGAGRSGWPLERRCRRHRCRLLGWRRRGEARGLRARSASSWSSCRRGGRGRELEGRRGGRDVTSSRPRGWWWYEGSSRAGEGAREGVEAERGLERRS